MAMNEERRLVTIMFADVTGSTALGESLDAEDLRALLARFYAIASEVVEAHGGTLEKFIGDAVMAVFGLPKAHGDDASRALAAALEIRDHVQADPRLGERLPIRLGVDTGEVIATAGARSGADFLITGDAVNVAARLQQSALPWTVVAGDRTARSAPGFRFGKLSPVEAKGKSAPISAVEVLGTAPVERPRLPLIGRDADLGQLELVARRAFSERRPFLATLIAPPGTGKTRLLEEFLEGLPDLEPDATVAIAQCLPYGQRLTYWPLRAVLHQLVGLAEDAPPEVVRNATRAWLTQLGVEDPARVALLLAATVGAGEAEGADPGQLFAAWRTLLETAAARAPLVVVFEDLHWSSDSLLDLVEHVLQPRPDVPLLMVVLTRPELLDRRPGWGGGRRNQVVLALEPLDDRSVAELVRNLLESADPELIDAVVARAEGNPFYAGELVRSLVDQGAGSQRLDPVQLIARLPDSVQSTVLARLDLLPAQERRALQLGAVFGRAFSVGGLIALEAGPAAGMEPAIATLLDRDMIRPAGADRFAFRHILIREVAYGTLPRAERARLHAAAARWLEDRAGDQEEAFAELIAYHYGEAASLMRALGLDAAEETRRRALRWLVRASEVAMAAAATGEAARHLRAAIDVAEPGSLADLHERLGDTQVSGDQTVEDYGAAHRLLLESGAPPDDRLRVLAKLLEYETRFTGSIGGRRSEDEMSVLFAEGEELMVQATDARARARFLVAKSFLPFWRAVPGRESGAAELMDAQAAGESALRMAEELGDVQLVSAALDGLGGVAVQHDDLAGFRRLAEQRIAMGDRLPLAERIDAYGVQIWACAFTGDLVAADSSSTQALALVQPGQVNAWQLSVSVWRAYAMLLHGKWPEVLIDVERAHRLWVDMGRSAALYAMRGFMAGFDVARARRDQVAVQRWRDVVLAITSQIWEGNRTSRSAQTYISLDLDAIRDRLHRVGMEDRTRVDVADHERDISLLVDFRESISFEMCKVILDTVIASGARPLEGQARRMLALITGDAAQASEAAQVFDSCQALPFAARARAEAALMSGDQDGYASAVAVLERLGDEDQILRYAAWAR
jgi:class 3 adenylate cyclase